MDEKKKMSLDDILKAEGYEQEKISLEQKIDGLKKFLDKLQELNAESDKFVTEHEYDTVTITFGEFRRKVQGMLDSMKDDTPQFVMFKVIKFIGELTSVIFFEEADKDE